MNRRGFLSTVASAGIVIGIPVSKLLASPRVSESNYDYFEEQRKSKEPLPPGMRWLTPNDVLQVGDEYDGLGREPKSHDIANGMPRWWKVGSKFTSIGPGCRVPECIFCYTPRGSINRNLLP